MIRERVIDGYREQLDADIAALEVVEQDHKRREQMHARMRIKASDKLHALRRERQHYDHCIDTAIVSDKVVDRVMTDIAVNQGVISDEHSGWFEDCELDSNGTA
jgi:hypothetical protein